MCVVLHRHGILTSYHRNKEPNYETNKTAKRDETYNTKYRMSKKKREFTHHTEILIPIQYMKYNLVRFFLMRRDAPVTLFQRHC